MFHREYIFEFGPFFIAIVSLLEGTERPRIQRHIYISRSIFLLKAQKIAIPLMYIPFLVCCSLHKRAESGM